MSFRQLFDRMNRYTRSHTFGGSGRTDREELRRAEELIEAERRRDEREREERERKKREPAATEAAADNATRTLYLQSIAVLSVPDGASWEEITTAYRRLITIAHPDRTSHLAPAGQEQAHRHAQEINIAYGFLSRYHGRKG